MAYIEFLRLRNGLTIFSCILSSLAILAMLVIELLARSHSLSIDHGGAVIPLSALIATAVLPALGFTSGFSSSLNRETDSGEIAWTRPMSRERLGVLYVLFDACGIALAFGIAAGLFALVALELGAVGSGVSLRVDAAAGSGIVLGLGVCFMWYGLVQAATAWRRERSGALSGLSWAVFVILASLAAFKVEPFHSIIMAANLLNPLAYKSLTGFATSDLSFSPSVHTGISVFAMGEWTRAAITFAIGAAACAVAVLSWKRVEL